MSGDGDDRILGFDRRKALFTASGAAVLAIGALALIGKAASYHKLADAVTRADKLWFPLCLAGEVVAYAAYIVGYRDLARARGGPHFDYWTATRVVGVGFGAYVVGASAGGLAVDYWALTRAGEEGHAAARRVLGLNTLEWGVLGGFAWIAAFVLVAGAGKGAPLPMTLGWLVAIPVFVAGGLYVSSGERAERLASLPVGEEPEERGRDPRLWARWLWVKAKKGFADAIGGVSFVRYLAGHPLRHVQTLLGFALYWCGDILCMYAAVRAFGHHIGVAAIVLGYTTGYVVTSAPLPAGAAGASEATTSLTLHLVGVPLPAAVLAVFAYRFFTFWLPILPALALLPSLRALDEELREADGDSEPARAGSG